MTRSFHKMHGLGNDFAVFDAREQPLAMSPALAMALADRHTGIGCDQLIVIEPSDGADVRMRIWNADGSEVEACGNASRCVAALVGKDCSIETAGGLLQASPTAEGASVDMDQPRFDWNGIPLAYAMDTAPLPLGWEMLDRPMAVNVGNPHLVFFVPDIDAVPLDDPRTYPTEAAFYERLFALPPAATFEGENGPVLYIYRLEDAAPAFSLTTPPTKQSELHRQI